MAQVIVDIPDAQVARVRTAFRGYFGYTGVVGGAAELAFFKQKVAEFVKRVVVEYEAQVAATNAADAARADANTLSIT
jgi:hypothetical protein